MIMTELAKRLIGIVAKKAGLTMEQAAEAYQESLTIGRPWICPDCAKVLDDWSYADFVDEGTPICGNCDVDMTLVTWTRLGLPEK